MNEYTSFKMNKNYLYFAFLQILSGLLTLMKQMVLKSDVVGRWWVGVIVIIVGAGEGLGADNDL